MKRILYLLMLIYLLFCKKEIKPDSDFNYPISNLETSQPNAENAIVGEDATIDDVSTSNMVARNEDWFLTKVLKPHTSTKNLFDLYGVDSFSEFRSKNIIRKFNMFLLNFELIRTLRHVDALIKNMIFIKKSLIILNLVFIKDLQMYTS